MSEITMPRLSDSMDEGTVATWLVPDGGQVAKDQEFVEIETDKTVIAFESEFSGTLRHLVEAGAVLPVGAPLARVDDDGGERGDADRGAEADRGEPGAAGPSPDSVAGVPGGAGDSARVHDEGAAERTAGRGYAGASPTATRLADRLGVHLETVAGSGRDGRILRADVIAAHEAAAQLPPPAPTPLLDADPRPGGRRPETSTPFARAERELLTRAQRLVAQRMVHSKSTIPEFTVSRDIRMDACVAFRREELTGERLSINDLVVAAVAQVLPDHPLLTAHYEDGSVVHGEGVNIAIAVTTDQVLQAPVMHAADTLGLRDIGERSRQLAARARSGRLAVDDVHGATFTVSNLGMFGVHHFTAIINAGQSAILAVGAVREDVVVEKGALRAGHKAMVTLTCDHRIVYGSDAARFLADLDAVLQDPSTLPA